MQRVDVEGPGRAKKEARFYQPLEEYKRYDYFENRLIVSYKVKYVLTI
jgi:hypothetical protein